MIASVHGEVEAAGDDYVVVRVGGVGLQVFTTGRVLAEAMPGVTVHLQTHFHFTERQLALFGFHSVAERALFQQLLTVSGLGTKYALALLSTHTPESLARAVESEDRASLQRAPGIGARLAARLVTELKGKVGLGGVPLAEAPRGGLQEIVAALEATGLSRAEALAAATAVPDDPNLTPEQRILLAFQAHGSRRG